MKPVVLLVAGALLSAPPLFAQSLGEAAKKERERRAGIKGQPGKVVTDEDLKRTSGETASPASATPAAREQDSRRGRRMTAAEEEGRGGGESFWRSRADEARQRIAAAESQLKAAETRAEALRLDMDPSRGLFDPNRMQRLEADRAAALAQVEKAKQDVAAARQAFSDLEEEARRGSVPPGWLRER